MSWVPQQYSILNSNITFRPPISSTASPSPYCKNSKIRSTRPSGPYSHFPGPRISHTTSHSSDFPFIFLNLWLMTLECTVQGLNASLFLLKTDYLFYSWSCWKVLASVSSINIRYVKHHLKSLVFIVTINTCDFRWCLTYQSLHPLTCWKEDNLLDTTVRSTGWLNPPGWRASPNSPQ